MNDKNLKWQVSNWKTKMWLRIEILHNKKSINIIIFQT
jgi:hypothetical protein